MTTSPRRPSASAQPRLPPLLALAAAFTLTVAVVLPARGEAASDPWTRTLQTTLSRGELGLPSSASAPTLARAALRRHAGRLGLRTSPRGLRLARDQRVPGGHGARALRALRFQQTVDGLRVVWSQVDVTIAAGRVRSVGATVVPVRATRPAGSRVIDRARALTIARRAVGGRNRAMRPSRVAYAGTPTIRRRARRVPRRAWLVEVRAADVNDGEEAPANICIVVDAESGEVIGRWLGMADRPRTMLPRARASATANLLRIHDGSLPGQGIYASFDVTGNPRLFSSWPTLDRARFLRPRTSAMDRIAANARNVASTICVGRGYCGDLGAPTPPSDSAWTVIGNVAAFNSTASRAFLTVSISQYHHMDVNAFNDIVAHEFGHVRDWIYSGDRRTGATTQAAEVEEALADMFAYDYDRGDATFGEQATLGGASRNWANPAALTLVGQPYPAHMEQYDSTPPASAPHFNSTVLSHAYHRFVQRVGHTKAGHVLLGVPQRLSPQPSFIEVARSFVSGAGAAYPQDGPDAGTSPDTAQAARAAFREVGLDAPICGLGFCIA